jgi:hypothetical protein
LRQAVEGRLEEACKLAKAIRRLAPDDPRNDEMDEYLQSEVEAVRRQRRRPLLRSPGRERRDAPPDAPAPHAGPGAR